MIQVRLNDRLYFDTANRLPGNKITGIDFFEDYVWVSTDGGLARFDLLSSNGKRSIQCEDSLIIVFLILRFITDWYGLCLITN